MDKVIREEDHDIDADLSSHRVYVERVPVRRIVDGPVADRWEGDTLVISVVEEVVRVERVLQVVEEVRVTRRDETKHVHATVPLRKEEVRIERRDD